MLDTLIKFGFNFVLFAILSIVLYNVVLVIIFFKQVRFAWNVNGFFLPCLPFLGTTYVGLFEGEKVNVSGMVLWLNKHFGMPFNFWFGYKYHYFTDKAEEAKIILNHPKALSKAGIYDGIQYTFKRSMLLLPGEEWKPRRHYLRTAFKLNIIKSLISTFYEQSSILNDKIQSMSPNVDLYHFFSNYSSLNFVLTMGGLDGSNVSPVVEQFGTLIDRGQDELVKFMLNPIIPSFIWMWTPSGIKLNNIIVEICQLMKKLLQNKMKIRAENSEYKDSSQDNRLIDLLANEVSEEEIDHDTLIEFGLFGSAASDTTGHTLAFCFTLFGMYPEIQQRVYEEVISVVGDGAIDQGHLQDLKYTEAYICESMRIFPAIPFFGRYCDQDINLGKKVIPKGSSVVVSAFYMHRNPSYWPDPLNFDPSRFFPENASKIVPGSYLPFSIGPRNCIGQSMAMTLMKITVANVIRKFRITSNHKSINEFVFESCISMKTTEPLDCIFHPRMID